MNNKNKSFNEYSEVNSLLSTIPGRDKKNHILRTILFFEETDIIRLLFSWSFIMNTQNSPTTPSLAMYSKIFIHNIFSFIFLQSINCPQVSGPAIVLLISWI